jgi:hypothetical protein
MVSTETYFISLRREKVKVRPLKWTHRVFHNFLSKKRLRSSFPQLSSGKAPASVNSNLRILNIERVHFLQGQKMIRVLHATARNSNLPIPGVHPDANEKNGIFSIPIQIGSVAAHALTGRG